MAERKRKASTSARGYGTMHQAARKRWAPLVEAGRVCVRAVARKFPPALIGIWGTMIEIGLRRMVWRLAGILSIGGATGRCSHRVRVEPEMRAGAVPPDDPERNVFYSPTGQRWSRLWREWR